MSKFKIDKQLSFDAKGNKMIIFIIMNRFEAISNHIVEIDLIHLLKITSFARRWNKKNTPEPLKTNTANMISS